MGFENVYWHFSEAKHGKSGADSVGGAIKTLLDSKVRDGLDILCAKDCIAANNSKVFMLEIMEEEYLSIAKSSKDLKSFASTRQIHQVAVDCTNGSVKFRPLTCHVCPANVKCEHYPGEMSMTFDQFYALTTIAIKQEIKTERKQRSNAGLNTKKGISLAQIIESEKDPDYFPENETKKRKSSSIQKNPKRQKANAK